VLDIQLVLLAKAPVAGRVKTRLSPPLTPQQAADVARASILDSLETVAQVGVRRRVVVLEGSSEGLVPTGFDVLPQRGEGLDERLAAAFADTWSALPVATLLIGMDTPQVTPELLVSAAEVLASGRPVLGHADDGGWWAIGLPAPDDDVFLGVPMSADDTGLRQEDRMRTRGLAPVLLPAQRDIDDIDDLLAVAQVMPSSSRVASVVRRLLVPA
jgi:rSAM/selenodomain-associated transferase 1